MHVGSGSLGTGCWSCKRGWVAEEGCLQVYCGWEADLRRVEGSPVRGFMEVRWLLLSTKENGPGTMHPNLKELQERGRSPGPFDRFPSLIPVKPERLAGHHSHGCSLRDSPAPEPAVAAALPWGLAVVPAPGPTPEGPSGRIPRGLTRSGPPSSGRFAGPKPGSSRGGRDSGVSRAFRGVPPCSPPRRSAAGAALHRSGGIM